MKSLISLILLSSALIACTSSKKQSIEGKWNSLKTKGFTAYFRSDSTFDAFENGKSFTSGHYKISEDTIFVEEPKSVLAIYTLQFIGDRVKWHVVSDTLSGRHNAIDGHEFERINN